MASLTFKECLLVLEFCPLSLKNYDLHIPSLNLVCYVFVDKSVLSESLFSSSQPHKHILLMGEKERYIDRVILFSSR